MNLLIISHYFWPENFRINQLAADLVARDIQVTVLTGHPNYPDGEFFENYGSSWPCWEKHKDGYDILRMPVIRRGGGSSSRLALNYASFLLSSLIFAPFMLAKRKFDVQFVFCTTPAIQGYIALWLKILRGPPVVQWVQDIWPEALSSTGHLGSKGVLGLLGWLVSKMYSMSDLILGQSRSFEQLLQKRAGGTPVGYLPNPGERLIKGVDGEYRLTGSFSIVFAGNIGQAQAISTIIEAAEILRFDHDIHFSLFGSGSAVPSLKEKISERGLANISLPGRVSPSSIYGYFEEASALLLTLTSSAAVSLTVPSKLQSYLAAGRPVLVSADGDARQIILEANAGLASPAEDGKALAMRIVEMKAMDASHRERLGANGRAYYDRNFSADLVADELVRILRVVASDETP